MKKTLFRAFSLATLFLYALPPPVFGEPVPLEVAKLLGSDGAAGDFFGVAAAIHNDTLVVGARMNDDAGSDSGSAYVFQRSPTGTWMEAAKLTASDAAAGDFFGFPVGISGDTIVVSAVLADAGATDSGAVYVFERNEGGPDNWGQVAKLTAPSPATSDHFGTGLGISVDTILVGNRLEDVPFSNAGAAYVFDRNQGGANNWGQVARLVASDAAANDSFGISASIDEDTAIVGASAIGSSTGAAYVFERNQGGPNNWGEVVRLVASNAAGGDAFGISVDVSGDTAVVGANSSDGAGAESGSAYVFERNEGGLNSWGEIAALTAFDAAAADFFGSSVTIDADTIAVGANQSDAAAFDAGAVYIFGRDKGGANNWGLVSQILHSDAMVADTFGFPVSVDVETLLVGSDRNDALGIDSGAAYVFDLNPVLLVNIDIKPGSFPNSINLSSGGATPVAILGSVELDVNDIDPDRLALGTAGIKTVGKTERPLCSVEDVSGDFSFGPEGTWDGFNDLVCHFVTTEIVPEEGDTDATVAGELFDGTPIEGKDSVNIVP